MGRLTVLSAIYMCTLQQSLTSLHAMCWIQHSQHILTVVSWIPNSQTLWCMHGSTIKEQIVVPHTERLI
jgi:hypothetical protein